jgi:hypothetical protein
MCISGEMLFREKVAACCENHTKHTNTLGDKMQQFKGIAYGAYT